MEEKIVLVYIGDGTSLAGVPARNLTQVLLDESGWSATDLIGTGLYKPASKEKQPPAENKSQSGGSENK